MDPVPWQVRLVFHVYGLGTAILGVLLLQGVLDGQEDCVRNRMAVEVKKERNNWVHGKQTDRETDRHRQMDKQTDRQMDKQTDRRTDKQRQTDRWTNKQTDRHFIHHFFAGIFCSSSLLRVTCVCSLVHTQHGYTSHPCMYTHLPTLTIIIIILAAIFVILIPLWLINHFKKNSLLDRQHKEGCCYEPVRVCSCLWHV